MVLVGGDYAIQDLMFVPEPGMAAQSITAIAVLALIGRLRSRGPRARANPTAAASTALTSH